MPSDDEDAGTPREGADGGSLERLRAMVGSPRDGIRDGIVVHDAGGEIVDSNAARLADSLAKLSVVLDNTPDVLAQLGADGTLLWASPSMRTVFGWDPKEIVGTRFRLAAPESRAHMEGLLYQAIREHADHYAARLQVVCGNGELRWADTNNTLVWNSAGELDSLVVVLRDVTERIQDAQALADSEEKYRLLAENATDAVYLATPNGTIQWVSPAVERLLGWTPEALVGTKSVTLVHFEDLRTYRAMVSDVESGRGPVTWEFRAKQAHGGYRWMSAVSSPVIDDDGASSGRITTLRDIDQQVHDRQALARSEQTFRLAMAGAPLGMAVVALHGAILQTNQVLCDLIGRDDTWLMDHHEQDIIHPDDIEADQAVRDRLLAGKSEFDIHEERLIDADGNEVWVQHSLALVRDEHGMPMFYVCQYQDITDSRQVRAELQYRVSHDTLTGLINREGLTRRLEHHLRRTRRSQGAFALLYCDLDNFKNVNDTEGHAFGDAVLQRAAERITSVLRDTDEVARLGGDEFVVLLADVTDTASALEVAEKIRKAVAAPMNIDGHTMRITLSIGVALAEPDVEGHRLLRNADNALYQAKQNGRDQTVVFGTQ